MAWPAGGISTANLDADGDSPKNARPDLKATVDAVNTMAAAYGAASGVASLDASAKVPTAQLPDAGFLPPGIMLPYAGSTAPSGWLLAYGQAVSRTTYAALFAIIGTTYGAGDGSTTFNLPDARGRVIAGKDNMGGTAASRLTAAGSGVDGTTLGASGGAETHTLTSAQIPAHTHPLNGGNSYYLMRTSGGAVGLTSGTGLADTVTNTGSNTGGGSAHNNAQPTLVENYIIKT